MERIGIHLALELCHPVKLAGGKLLAQVSHPMILTLGIELAITSAAISFFPLQALSSLELLKKT